MHPTPTEMHPNTGVDPEQVSRIDKTDPPAPPGTMAPGAREGPTWETNASSNATAESAFDNDCVELASLAKPGAKKHLPKLSGGRRQSKKSLRH